MGREKSKGVTETPVVTPASLLWLHCYDYSAFCEQQPHFTDKETEAQRDKCLCEPRDTMELDQAVPSPKVGAERCEGP